MNCRKSLVLALFGLTLVLSAAPGCNSQPKDPFEDWYAPWKYHNFVPLTAKTVASGADVLTYTTPEQGTLYLVDMDQMVKVEGFDKPKLVGTGLVPANTEVVFEPSQKWIHAKGKQGVKLTEVVPGHHFELRFDPSEKPKQ